MAWHNIVIWPVMWFVCMTVGHCYCSHILVSLKPWLLHLTIIFNSCFVRIFVYDFIFYFYFNLYVCSWCEIYLTLGIRTRSHHCATHTVSRQELLSMLICQGWSFQGLPSNQVRKAHGRGGGETPISDRDACQKIQIKPRRETNVGVAQA